MKKRVPQSLGLAFFLVFIASFFSFTQGAAPLDPTTIGKRVFHAAPKLLVVLPEPNATIFGREVTVRLVIENLILTDPERKSKAQQGEGHIHIWLDDKEPTTNPALESYNVDDSLFTNVPPREHELRVELVNNDHSSFTPPVVQTVRFTTVVKERETSSHSPTSTPTIPPSFSQQSAYIMPAILGAVFLIVVGLLLRKVS